MNYPAWQLKKADPAAETSLAGAGCGVLLRRVLAARGCTDPAAAQALLGQGEPLSDPFLLTDMDKAVVRIQEAIENEELMVIYGDYDVDGISATAILYECLTSQGAHVRCKLPTRGSGYGLTRAALESLASKGFKLVVTVDNGISAVEEAACAKELGLDLIITDHHLPGDTLPDAIAVVDPKRPDDESPFKDLCGAGVAFKLCAALEGCDPAELLEMYGELAALGTVLRDGSSGTIGQGKLFAALIDDAGHLDDNFHRLAEVVAIQAQAGRSTVAQHTIQKVHQQTALAAQPIGIADTFPLEPLAFCLGLAVQLSLCLFHPLDVIGIQRGKIKFLFKDLHGTLLSKKPPPGAGEGCIGSLRLRRWWCSRTPPGCRCPSHRRQRWRSRPQSRRRRT